MPVRAKARDTITRFHLSALIAAILYLGAKLTAKLIRARQAIEKHTGTTPRFFHPPFGLSNPFTFRVAKALGLKVIGWTFAVSTRASLIPQELCAGSSETCGPAPSSYCTTATSPSSDWSPR